MSELRVVVTATDLDEGLASYRDVLGPPGASGRLVTSRPGRHLDAGRATLEPADPAHAAYVDDVRVSPTAIGGGVPDGRPRVPDRPSTVGALVKHPPRPQGRLQVWTSGTNPRRSTSPRTRA
jgi:lactoylglutathione lyase